VGTAFSPTGKVIFALRSVDKQGESNIVFEHKKDRDRLRSTLGAARYIVTEFGVANLFGKSIRERAIAMIDIAHPDHRETLFKQAKEGGYLFHDQIYLSKNIVDYPEKLETIKTFKDGLELKIRPIRPSDEDGMRRLFYNFSDESKYLRYFTTVRTMPHQNMQKYIQVDYKKSLSIVAVLQIGHSERIIAEARYASQDGKRYEMAFLVDESFHGKGIGSFLVNYLIQIAKETGIKTLYADVLRQNEKMLTVFDKASVVPKKKASADVFTLEFRLD
jgi:GNAT superfamily N-acetyltransferase